jgi:hypothetical protein
VLHRESEAKVQGLEGLGSGSGAQGQGSRGTSPPISDCTLNVWHLGTPAPKLRLIGYDVQACLST